VVGAEALSLVKDYIEKHGGIAGVVSEFEKNGFGQQVRSWVRPQLSCDPEQVRQTIGLVKLKQMANQFGIPVDKVTEQLAKYIPAVVDKATPEGKLPT